MSSPEKDEDNPKNQNNKSINNDNNDPGLYTLQSLSQEFNTLEKKEELLNFEDLKNYNENPESNEYINNYQENDALHLLYDKKLRYQD